jgi:PKD repeat protein
VVVNDIPRPENLNLQASSCPINTGFIGLNNPSGRGSFTYTVNGESQSNPEFNFLAPGIYDVSVESSTGCSWDSTLTIPLNPPQEAIFESRPESGYTPLETVFINQSTNAEFYTWLINGEVVSDSRNFGETFSEPGTYEISLIAYVDNENCADTTSLILIVNQGLEMIIPNIITPNGDGQNDQLVAQIFGAASLRWTIFDRWGNELFSGNTSTIEESLVLWEPTDSVKDGQYFLVAVGFGEDGQRQEVKATVTVLR